MDVSKIPTGQDPPEEINAVIEIPAGDTAAKYELDTSSGAVFVDRFLHTSMRYPANYGFIPRTLAADGDPLDVLVVSPAPVHPGAVIPCRPIGVLLTTDQSGKDEKILAVPLERIHPLFDDVRTYLDLPLHQREQIVHFFEHYKDLEPDKWVTVNDWLGLSEAYAIIRQAIASFGNTDAIPARPPGVTP
jgi:inorganic pyrophosphatase